MARWWVQGFPSRHKGAEAGLSGYIGRAPKELQSEDNGDWIEVAPVDRPVSDLTRELYEALKLFHSGDWRRNGQDPWFRAEGPIARYEQEVGE